MAIERILTSRAFWTAFLLAGAAGIAAASRFDTAFDDAANLLITVSLWVSSASLFVAAAQIARSASAATAAADAASAAVNAMHRRVTASDLGRVVASLSAIQEAHANRQWQRAVAMYGECMRLLADIGGQHQRLTEEEGRLVRATLLQIARLKDQAMDSLSADQEPNISTTFRRTLQKAIVLMTELESQARTDPTGEATDA